MAYELQVLGRGRVLLMRAGEEMTLEDMRAASYQIQSHCRRTEGTIHLIADMLRTETHPNDILELKKSVTWTRESNVGWVIYLSNNHFLNILVDTIMNMYGQSYLVLDDINAALSIVMADSQPVD